ncbi:hypothetical protein ACUOFC_61010, partial [Escherichia sp. TWPC-MK]
AAATNPTGPSNNPIALPKNPTAPAAALIGTGVVAYKAYQKATEDSIASVDRFATNNKLAQDEYQKALASSDAATKKYMNQQTIFS